MLSNDLNDDNYYIFAAKHYYNPLGVDAEEFEQDLKRFKYIKRLVNRYLSGGELKVRLILNHIIVINNVFGVKAALDILKLKLCEKHISVIKPFLLYQRMIENDDSYFLRFKQDWLVVEEIRKLRNENL